MQVNKTKLRKNSSLCRVFLHDLHWKKHTIWRGLFQFSNFFVQVTFNFKQCLIAFILFVFEYPMTSRDVYDDWKILFRPYSNKKIQLCYYLKCSLFTFYLVFLLLTQSFHLRVGCCMCIPVNFFYKGTFRSATVIDPIFIIFLII